MLLSNVITVKLWLDIDRSKGRGKDEISTAISEYVVFIILYTDGYFRSPKCCEELQAAIDLEKQEI